MKEKIRSRLLFIHFVCRMLMDECFISSLELSALLVVCCMGMLHSAMLAIDCYVGIHPDVLYLFND